MSDRAIVVLCRSAAVGGVVLALAGSAGIIWLGEFELWLTESLAVITVLSLFFAVFVWMVIPSQPRNAVVWSMTSSPFFGGLFMLGNLIVISVDPELIGSETVVPLHDFPTLYRWIMLLAGPAWIGTVVPLLTFGLLLFPDGRFPSPRWRWVSVLAAVSIALAALSDVWSFRPWADVYLEGPLLVPAIGLQMVAFLLSLAALVTRFRKSRGETRQAFKWVVWGASIFIPVLILSIAVEWTEYRTALSIPNMLAAAVFVSSYGIAVGRYRLYDIDIVISRTFVYGSLAVFITGVYVAAVVGIGSLLDTEAGESPWLPIGATALVAFAFEPLRSRLQRLANRLVYGKRATPYEVLSDFSRRLTSTDENLLPRVARSLAEGTTARAAGVWLQRGGGLERVAVWPENRADGSTGYGAAASDAELRKPVIHDGETLGALSLWAARGQTLLPSDERLLEQMAGGMGLALRNIRLSADLKQDVEKLRLSRQRLLTAQDETRRHLERQLHDGAQQRLVALKLKLALTKTKAEVSGVPGVADLLEEAALETDQTVDSLRDFARGIYPPLLESEGLAAALTSQAAKLPIAVTVHAHGVGRYSRGLEAAIYFSILEALQNVIKHANAGSAHVALRSSNGTLTFEVSDDGQGFDPDAVESGSGLANLTDRLDTLDGTLEVASSPGAGTTLLGHVPVQEKVAVP